MPIRLLELMDGRRTTEKYRSQKFCAHMTIQNTFSITLDFIFSIAVVKYRSEFTGAVSSMQDATKTHVIAFQLGMRNQGGAVVQLFRDVRL